MPEKLYKLDLLKKLSHNNEEVIRKLMHVFIEQASKAVAEIKAAYEVEKFDMVSSIAHKIKPTYGYFGIPDIEKDIEMIELLANLETASSDLEKLIRHLETITRAVIEDMKEDIEVSTSTYPKTELVTN